MDDKPSQLQLKRFLLNNGKYTNIYQRIGTNYKSFGIFLLNDGDGGKVMNAESNPGCSPVKICERIVEDWLTGKGIVVTWEAFLDCLRCAELNVLAEDVEEALQDKDAKPNLPTLREFVGKDGKVFDVIERIGVEYHGFGTFLLRDDEGSKVKNIAAIAENNPVNICEKIVSEWCAGRGKRPTTWRTFIGCLRRAQLNVLAGDIEMALQTRQPDKRHQAIATGRENGAGAVRSSTTHRGDVSTPAAAGESPESRTIRTNLTKITHLLSTVVSPTWFAQKLEEIAFMADASRKLVLGKSDSDNVSTFVNAVKVQINTSQTPVDEFAKFMIILQSQPALENLFRQLFEEYKLNGGNTDALRKLLATKYYIRD